tara:strand:- start:425 stop:955 length:531 start_codon:yes stop_codon:yes gene_type:complete
MNSPMPNIPNRRKAVRELRDWLLTIPFTHFITFNFNRQATHKSATNALRKWHAGIDRRMLGRHFNKLDASNRTFFWAFFEHAETNLHAHALVICHKAEFNDLAQAVWKCVIPSGTLDISRDLTEMTQFLKQPEIVEQYYNTQAQRDLQNIVSYVLKEQWKDVAYDSFLCSSMFLPK